MAIAADSAWRIQFGGNSLNGGCYSPSVGGVGSVDYTQQNAAQLTVSDAACTGNTTLTSATGGFTAAMKGNGLWIAGDNGYQITAVASSNSLTLDKNGPNASGLTARVGGAQTLDQLGFAFKNLVVAGQKINVKADGTYLLTVNSISTSGAAPGAGGRPITVEGFLTTPGDGGRATIHRAGDTISVFAVIVDFWIFKNFNLDVGGSSSPCILVNGGNNCWFKNIIASGGTAGAYALNMSNGTGNRFRHCWFKSATASAGDAVRLVGGGHLMEYCIVSGQGATSSTGISVEGGPSEIRGCIVRNHSRDGISFASGDLYGATLRSNVIWNNGRDNVRIDATANLGVLDLIGNILGRATAYDVNYTPADVSAVTGPPDWQSVAMACNFFFTTGTGRVRQLPAETNFTALTANPFLDDTTTFNFGLNATAGGGAAVSAGVCVENYADDLNVSRLLAGIDGTVLVPTPTATATMRSLWREATNERFTPSDPNSAVPDATVDIYLDYGLQALNREAHYHVADGTIALVAGQQEYSLPIDFVLAFWLQFGGFRKLNRSDEEHWMSRNIDWRNEPAGEPQEWAIYANKLILRPAPSAEAVTAAPNLTLRYCSMPPSITSSGAEQLGSQEYRLVVLYGALLWSMLYPESLVAQQRIAELQKVWDTSVQRVIQEYGQRNISS